MSNTPEAIIGLKLDSVGIDQAAGGAEKLAGHLSNVTKEISTIGVGIGVGGLLRDFVAIEGSAARTASYMGSITGGMSGYSGLAQSALGVQARTGVAAGQTLGAAAMIASLTGGRGLAGNPAAQAGLLGALGTYGAAYQVNPTELASSLGPLLQSAGLSGAAGKPMLNMLAGNAYAGGMGNNFPSYLSGVGSMATSAVATNPGLSKFGGQVAGGLSTMYNQAAAGNPAYLNNPSLFQQGETAVSSSLQGAYQNPRMTLALESMGINYWDARQGLAGPQGQANASKILKYSAEQFGEGTTYQDAWLRANFGELNGTEALKAIAAGKKAGAGGASASQRRAAQGLVSQRAAQGSTTPGANLERARGGIEHGVFGAVGGDINGLFGLQAASPFGALAGSYAAMKLLGLGGRAIGGLGGVGGVGGAAGTGLLGLGSVLAGGAIGGGIGLGVGDLFKEIGLGSSLKKASEQFFHNPLGTIAEGYDTGFHDIFGGENPMEKRAKEHNRAGANYPGLKGSFQKAAVERILGGAEAKFGAGYWHNDAGGEKANKWIHQQEGIYKVSGIAGTINESIQNQREYSTLGAQGYSTKKFGDSVSEFGQYVKTLKGGSGNKTASYLSSIPGVNNAAGLQNVSDIVGGGMALTHDISMLSTNSSGSGAQLASNSGGGESKTITTGMNSGGGGKNRVIIEAAAKKYGVPFNVLWGVYGAESSWGKGGSNWFGLVAVPRTGSFEGDANQAAATLARLYKEYGSWNAALEAYSGHSYGLSHVEELGGSGGTTKGSGTSHSAAPAPNSSGSGVLSGGGAVPHAITASDRAPVVHVHIDGRQVERQRRLVRGIRV